MRFYYKTIISVISIYLNSEIIPNNSFLLNEINTSSQELPYVRYASKESDDYTPTARELVPTKLANAVWDLVSKYKSTIPNFPQNETCDLLIVDRSIDQVKNIFFTAKLSIYIITFSIHRCVQSMWADCSCHSWMDLWRYVPWFVGYGRK